VNGAVSDGFFWCGLRFVLIWIGEKWVGICDGVIWCGLRENAVPNGVVWVRTEKTEMG
jgi:hypothetical protein